MTGRDGSSAFAASAVSSRSGRLSAPVMWERPKSAASRTSTSWAPSPTSCCTRVRSMVRGTHAPLQGMCPGLRAHERSVLDAVRLPVGAVLFAHLLLVRLVVAFQPPHAAIAFEHEHVRRDAVEEPPI